MFVNAHHVLHWIHIESYRALQQVCVDADALAHRGKFKRWISSRADAETLTDMKEKVAQAYQSFHVGCV